LPALLTGWFGEGLALAVGFGVGFGFRSAL
jgi:hypothetical protein